MEFLTTFYLDHPFWVWMGLAALLLAIEIGTGSGWLLWPAGSAAVVAFVTFANAPWPLEVLLFAVLAIVSTFVGRRYLNKTMPRGPDINDPHARLVGHEGVAASVFDQGQGRVLVDGKEWAAEAEATLERGDKVKVVSVLDGARLKVAAA